MTARPPDPGPRPAPSDEDIDWVAGHQPEFRPRLAGNEILYWWIGITVVIGLLANVSGFLWAADASGTADALGASLLQTLGAALWTGAVLVFFVQVIPNVQRRAAIRALRHYERQIDEPPGGDGGAGPG